MQGSLGPCPSVCLSPQGGEDTVQGPCLCSKPISFSPAPPKTNSVNEFCREPGAGVGVNILPLGGAGVLERRCFFCEESTCQQQLEWRCPRSNGESSGTVPSPHSLCDLGLRFPFCKAILDLNHKGSEMAKLPGEVKRYYPGSSRRGSVVNESD